MSKVKPNL